MKFIMQKFEAAWS